MREDVCILVAGGIVRRVATTRGAVRRLRAEAPRSLELEHGLLVPAFVNAHAHLELSGLAGRVAPGRTFADWIRSVIAARAESTSAAFVRAARLGCARLLATGTTLVGDVDSTGAIVPASLGSALVVRRFREALDAGDPARTGAVLKRVRARAVRRKHFHEGLSPHAPYTVGAALALALGRLARERGWPLAIHFAETREEGAWLAEGRGPLAGLLARSPGERGLDLIERAGLLGPRTLLVHANHATRAERERVRAAGASVVHCPGTHAFFARAPFDARAWLDLGVPLSLGTDSLASNQDLDMRRELRLFAASARGVSPEEAWRAATVHGARALGFAGRAGEIAPEAWADLSWFDVSRGSARAMLAELVHGEGRCLATFARGRRVYPEPGL